MKNLRPPATLACSALAAALFGSTFFVAAHHAAGQQGYSTNFNPPAFTAGSTLSDIGGWTTNDEDTGQTYNGQSIGQSDDTQGATGYTSGTGDYAALLGGVFNTPAAGSTLPGHSTVTLTHSANLPATGVAEFDTDYVVSVPGTIHTGHDSFGFVFQNNTLNPITSTNITTNLFSVNFVPTSTNSTSLDNITVTSAAGTSAGLASFTLGKRYKLTVGVNLTLHTFSVGFTAETNTGAIVPGTLPTMIATNMLYTGTLTDIGATWVLAAPTTSAAGNGGTPGGTAFTSGGDNTILFDNFSVMNVPEPSTYALVGGALALMMVAVKRRSQKA